MPQLKTEAEKLTAEQLIERSKKPSMRATPLHKFYGGKVQIMPKCAITCPEDIAWTYTPGVADPCREIHTNKDMSFELTNRGNCIAVVSDGTRVLGLGNIGPEAAMPVMEGKALLFKYLGGVDAVPICLKTRDPEEIIRICELIEPSYGGINLEDIESPKCFHVLEKARERLQIPVWHDDQQGTATVILAGLINSFKIVGKNPKESLITLVGAGAANTRNAYVLMRWGVKPGNIIMVDINGIIHPGRNDIKEKENPWLHYLAQKTNSEGREGDISLAFKDADAVVAASTPGPDVIKKEWIPTMGNDPIVFACANPTPEILPEKAKEAGARIIATGRSDFKNQVNNSLAFPGIFRGVLDVKAKTITDDMCIAAACELALFAEERGMHEDYILPRTEEWEVFPRVAVACALQSINEGVARIKPSRQDLYDKATAVIKNARESLEVLMKDGLIRCPPPEEELLK